MQLEQQESFEIKGPQLEVFGETETKLPAPAKKRPVAAIVLAVVAIISVFGIGGAKLNSRYQKVQSVYTQVDKYNHGIQTELASQADAAANLLRLAQNVLGADDVSCTAMAAALDAWNAADATPAAQSAASTTLYNTTETVYNAASKQAEGDIKSRLKGLHDEFTTAHFNVNTYVSEEYAPAVKNYNKTAGGFPANLIGAVWGTAKAEAYTGQ